MTIMGDNVAEDVEITEALVDVEIIAIPITAMTIKNEDLDTAKDNVIQITVEGVVMIIHTKDEEDSGMEMTRITVTETVGIEIMIVKVILTGVDDGIIIVEVKGHSDRGRGRRWNPNQQYHDPGYQQESQFQNPNHY